jgi:hypothetical protein
MSAIDITGPPLWQHVRRLLAFTRLGRRSLIAPTRRS